LSANGEARFSEKRNFRFALPCELISQHLFSNSLKMKKQQLLPLLCSMFVAASLSAQIQFSKKTNLLTPDIHYSGVAIAVLDMNGDGRDDIVRMNQGFQIAIEYQTAPDQPFTHLPVGSVSGGSQWGMCAADVDNNGFPDVLTGGAYDDIKLVMANASGSVYNIGTLDEPGTFVQCVNFADINSDGWLDAFVCHDDGASRIFGNDGTGNLLLQTGWMPLATVPASDNSGNYGSVWSDVDNDGDLDLYIAKCRQGVNEPTDGRRINQLFLNNGDGTYTQDTSNASGLRIGAQSWTADFGDIDNDGDFDCFITNHDVSSQLLENDGAGHFTDISVTSGIFNTIGGLAIQGIFRDFDNDGFVDILVAGTQHYLLRNNGDKTFSVIPNLFDNNQIESVAVGDLNHDGFQDIYAGYAQVYTEPSNIPDALWMNVGNDNNFFGLNLRGVQSNRNAVGAKILLYSALGTQVREVRAGESYGIMNSMQIHFGLGQLTTIDSVKIYWPSDSVDILFQPDVNQYLTVQEGGCIVPEVKVTPDGPTTFCSGQSVNLSVADSFATFAWNTGDTMATVTATAAGSYFVTVTTADGCTVVSSAIAVTVDPVEIPIVTASDETTFCAGGSVTLTSSTAAAYTWSTGDTTQSIVVTQPGDYTVTTQGLCEEFTSTPQSIVTLDNPPPVALGDTVAPNGIATLVAIGNHVSWYDAAAGGNLVFTGDTLVTSNLQESVTYWVSDTTIYDQPNQFTGMTDHQGNQFGDFNFNGAIIFDCFEPFRLAKVKVYANTAAVRKIDLLNNIGEVVQSKSVSIPAGTTVIDLDLDIPVGNDFVLTTDANVNFANLGSGGPQLRRSTQGVNYPYEIPNVVSIKNSNFGEFRYYYFYDWEIDYYGYECTSERVPVTAFVDTTLIAVGEPTWAAGLRVFPNPTSGIVTVEMENAASGDIFISIKNTQGVVVQSRRLEAVSGKTTFQSDLSPLPKGVYWLELATGKEAVRRKIIVQ
jgi:hypothetical protein